MPIPSWTQSVDQLFTTTWMKRRPKAELQAFKKTPLIDWLRKRDRIERVTGYTRCEIPLEYGSNETVRWIGKGSTVPLQDSELATMAYDDWRYVAVSILRYGTDEQKNRGKARLISLVNMKMGAAERALWETFEEVFFSDGTGSLEPNGMQNLVDVDPTTGSLHNMNRATYPWFRNQTKTASGAASVYLEKDMRNLFNTCTSYAKAEINDYVIVTDQTTHELYEDEFDERHRIVTADPSSASLGFTDIRFKGQPMFWSPSAPSGEMRFLNTNYLKLLIDEEYWMDMTEWKSIPNQVNDRVAQILCTCQS